MSISMKLLQEIVNYLEQRPFREVAVLLNGVQTEYAASQMAKPEVEPIDNKE